jgi:hypothetical protein
VTVMAFGSEAFWDRSLAPLFSREWIHEAVARTDRESDRQRRLTAESVVLLVVAMGLFREQSIVDLVWKFGLARSAPSDGPLRSNAITQARKRLGEEPVHALLERTAREWAVPSAETHRWRGLAIVGIDGTTMRVADSPENREAFGVHRCQHGRSSYPLLRCVALMALRSHLILDAILGAFKGTSEVGFAESLIPKIPDQSLTILDRGFWSVWLWSRITGEGTHRYWLIRAKSTARWRVIKTHAPGDERVEIQVPDEARSKHPSLPRTLHARAIRYHRRGFRPQVLLTSLLDPREWPAAEIIVLYHERWDLELALDEIKTETLQRKETLRSRTPTGVRQEMWGVFVGYNVVRHQMEQTANLANVAPVRISFVGVLRIVRERWLARTEGPRADVLRQMRSEVRWQALLILPPRRSERQYPRAVKRTMSPYPRKRVSQAA